jgi:hypothetical protein
MARYIYMVQGCDHKFTTKQEAQDYASFDRCIEFMHGKAPSITIISRLTPKQYKQMQARKQLAQEAQQ